METFGNRLAALRKEIGLSQRALGASTGLGQPRIAHLELGDQLASVAIIEKLASALNRPPRELAAGTDREGYYFSQTLGVEELASVALMRKSMRDATAVFLRAGYERVLALFQALHAGQYVVAAVSGEEIYRSLRSYCEMLHAGLEGAPALYFPDHFEIIDADDVNGWEFEEPDLRRSLVELRAYVHELGVSREVDEESRKQFAEVFGPLDESIASLRKAQIEQSRKWWDRVERTLHDRRGGDG